MNLTLNLEWSKKLHEAGIEGKYKYCQYEGLDGKSVVCPSWNLIHNTTKYPSYTLEELLDMVEGEVKVLHLYRGIWYFDYGGRVEEFESLDPKICVCEALLWQKGEGR